MIISVPAPWLKIDLLKILAKLGYNDEITSQQIYPVLQKVLARTVPTHTMGLAVIQECLDTICTIYQNDSLLELGSKFMNKF